MIRSQSIIEKSSGSNNHKKMWIHKDIPRAIDKLAGVF